MCMSGCSSISSFTLLTYLGKKTVAGKGGLDAWHQEHWGLGRGFDTFSDLLPLALESYIPNPKL